jgi:DnaJ like chaperone protein
VKRFLETNFGAAQTPQYVKMLGEILKQDFNVQDVSRQIAQYMGYESRMMLVQYLFGIAQADGNNHPDEIDMIQTIAGFMGVNQRDYESIKAMFVKDTGSAYQVLDVSPDASNDEIKKAYRDLAKKHHPDRVAHLGEDVKKAAELKFTKLNAAYEAIKEERGMN